MTKDKLLIELGSRVRALREEQELTQDEAAFKSDLARSYYGDVERGSRNVSVINLHKIAKALGVSVKDFF